MGKLNPFKGKPLERLLRPPIFRETNIPTPGVKSERQKKKDRAAAASIGQPVFGPGKSLIGQAGSGSTKLGSGGDR